MYVTPTQSGAQVPDPDRGDALPPKGRSVPATQYWMRRIADGSVSVSEPPPDQPTPSPAPAPDATEE